MPVVGAPAVPVLGLPAVALACPAVPVPVLLPLPAVPPVPLSLVPHAAKENNDKKERAETVRSRVLWVIGSHSLLGSLNTFG